MQELVTVSNGQVVVSSQQVAEKFGKEHKNVLQNIEGILRSAENSAYLFMESSYIDKWNRNKPEYLMSRDGFSLLAMGFTGQKALEWKLKFIEAFNEMERQILQNNPVVNLPDFTNPVIAARAWADAMEGKQLAEQKVAELQPSAEMADRYMQAEGTVNFREMCKQLKVKEPVMKKVLLNIKFLYLSQSGKPQVYKEMVKRGYAVTKDFCGKWNNHTGTYVRYTMKGKDYIRQKLEDLGIECI